MQPKRLWLDPEGRLVLPKEVLEAMGWEPDQRMHVTEENQKSGR